MSSERSRGPYAPWVGAFALTVGAVLWRRWRRGAHVYRGAAGEAALLVGLGFVAGYLAAPRPRRAAARPARRWRPPMRAAEDLGEIATDGGGVCEGWVPHQEVNPDDVEPEEID